jgi:hypothetical protein
MSYLNQMDFLNYISKTILPDYYCRARYWWLTPIIRATQEAKIMRIEVQGQPRQVVHEALSQKYPSQKKGWWSGSRSRP